MTDIPLLGPLFSLLVCLAKYVVGGVLWALVSAVNGLVSAVAAAVAGLLSLLPVVDMPQISAGGSLAFLNRFAPISEALLAAGVVLSALIGWHVVVPLLRKFGVVS